jgi:hypothetical protein
MTTLNITSKAETGYIHSYAKPEGQVPEQERPSLDQAKSKPSITKRLCAMITSIWRNIFNYSVRIKGLESEKKHLLSPVQEEELNGNDCCVVNPSKPNFQRNILYSEIQKKYEKLFNTTMRGKYIEELTNKRNRLLEKDKGNMISYFGSNKLHAITHFLEGIKQ